MKDDVVYSLQCPNGHWEPRYDRFFAQGIRLDTYGFRCKKCGELMSIFFEHPQVFGMQLRVWCPDCPWEWRVPLVPDSALNAWTTMLATAETFDPMREDRHWWTPPDFATIPPHRHPAKQKGQPV